MANLDGKRAIITGASQGIGRAMAELFLAEGASLLAASRRPPALAEVPEERYLWQATDVADPDQVEALFATARARFGGLDVLVNNAGVQLEKTVAETSDEDWDRLMDVNMKGLFRCCRAAIRLMRETGGGTIINIGSVAGIIADHGLGIYNASKAGVHGLTRSIAVDHGPDGVRCNAICPGWIMTEMAEEAFAQADDPEALKRKAVQHHPVGRLGRPEDVAAMAAWLASDDARFASGQLFTIDGALSAGSPINPNIP